MNACLVCHVQGSMRGSVARIAEANNSLRRELGRWPTYDEIAEAADLGVSSVRLVRERTRHPISLDQPMSNQGSITLKVLFSSSVFFIFYQHVNEPIIVHRGKHHDLIHLIL